jgi:hypothetical protein
MDWQLVVLSINQHSKLKLNENIKSLWTHPILAAIKHLHKKELKSAEPFIHGPEII